MKLLVITMLYEPDCVGIAAIASDMCQSLAERGHDVTVYTAYPYYPEWTNKTGANPWRVRQETLSGVTVRRHGLFVPKHPSRLIPRLVHELSFPMSLTRSVFAGPRADAVMVFCPLMGSVAFAALRKLCRREPLWVNVQDIPAEAGKATGISQAGWFHALGAWAQRVLFNSGEVWSSISPAMISQLETYKKNEIQLHLVPNWLTGSLARQIASMPSKVGRPAGRPLELLYSGTIGRKQGLLTFCRALQQSDLDFRFRIRGDGGEACHVREWMELRRDDRFEMDGLLPEDEFVRAIHTADWFVISEKSGAGSSFLPSKMIPSISIGTPILAITSGEGPFADEMTNSGVGLMLQWHELDQLPARLRHLRDHSDDFVAMQRRCLAHAALYQREPAIARLETLLQNLAGRHPRQAE